MVLESYVLLPAGESVSGILIVVVIAPQYVQSSVTMPREASVVVEAVRNQDAMFVDIVMSLFQLFRGEPVCRYDVCVGVEAVIEGSQ